MNRVRNGSSSRPGSGVGENTRMLRDTVVRLEQELLDSRAETKKVSDQLSCLMLLVKRAWTGDKAAATNVANIVGVAPPDFHEEKTGAYTTVTAKPKVTTEETIQPPKVLMKNKSKALNNWALLTIGVLNREYKQLESQQELKVRLYLQNRQRYLEEQLVYQRDIRIRDQPQDYEPVERIAQPTPLQTLEPSHKPLHRSNSLTELGNMRQRGGSVTEQTPSNKAFITQPNQRQPNVRPQSTKVRGPARPLYRPTGHHPVEQSNLTWADLIVEPGQPHAVDTGTQQINGSFYKMADRPVDKTEKKQRTKYRVPYDHPDRYTVNGLYDADNAMGPGNSVFRKRPPSSKDQRQSDHLRSRPKSAVYVRGERSLKYETTRPVSAVISSKSKNNTGQGSKKPPSGKLVNCSTKSAPSLSSKSSKDGNTRKNHEQNNSNEEDEEDAMEKPNDQDIGPWTDSEEEVEKLIYDDTTFSKLGIDMKEVEREVRLARAMRVNITKPQCVLDFEQDVRNMVSMERQIRKTTEDLQRKLGICENGMV